MVEYINGFMDGGDIVFITRDENGRRSRKRVKGQYVSFLRRSDVPLEVARQLKGSRHIVGFDETPEWIRLQWRDKETRLSGVSPEGPLSQKGLKSYEGDVHPIRRFFSDNPDAKIGKPERGYVDLETDSRVPFSRKESARILSWALVSADRQRIEKAVLEADSDDAEAQLLGSYWEAVQAYDQQCAWNGDFFDFRMLEARSEYLGLQVPFKQWLYLDHLIVYRRYALQTSETGEEKQNFRLQTVAMTVLKKGKDPFDARYTWEAWAEGGAERERMLKYNVQDTVLLSEIEEKTGYLATFETTCDVCKLFPETRSANPTQQMDGFMLRLGVEKDSHFSTRYYTDEQPEKFKGAYVLEPQESGILKGVHVGDFAALYPSIILTWNMSPETKGPRVQRGEVVPPDHCRSPLTGITFTTKKVGILPTAVAELIRLRAEWKDLKDSLAPGTEGWYDADRRSTSYKVIANSFYGVVGSPFSRFFDRDVAESITQNGVWLIKQTMELAAHRGMKTVYGDTDSLFIRGISNEGFASFVADCNRDLYPDLLKGLGCPVNKIKLAYEKAFERIVFTGSKRYVGAWDHYKGKKATADSKPEVKGLEYRRSDTNALARQMQWAIIQIFANKKSENPSDYEPLLDLMRDRVLQEDLPMEVVIVSKALTKPLEEYAGGRDDEEASLAHVRVAKVMKARGEEVGVRSRIEYIVTDSTTTPTSVIPASDYAGDSDRYYLWENLVYPATQRLLIAIFPDLRAKWDAFEKVRPQKPRARKVNPDQGAFDFRPSSAVPELLPQPGLRQAPAVANASTNAPSMGIAVTSRIAPFLVTLLPDQVKYLSRVLKTLEKYPGKRPAQLVTARFNESKKRTERYIKPLPLKVDGSPELRKELSEILDEETSEMVVPA